MGVANVLLEKTNQTWVDPEWHDKINSAKLKKQKFKTLFHYLGKKMALIPVHEGSLIEEDKAHEVWGNFNQFHQTLSRLEEQMGRAGEK